MWVENRVHTGFQLAAAGYGDDCRRRALAFAEAVGNLKQLRGVIRGPHSRGEHQGVTGLFTVAPQSSAINPTEGLEPPDGRD